MSDEASANDHRCRCRHGVILGDCPMSFANAAHDRGDTYGKTLEEFMTEAPGYRGSAASARSAEVTKRERDLEAAVAGALANLLALQRYRHDAGVTISPPQCERDVWEHIQRAIDALRRVEPSS